jgi:biopolymer transport protein ExbB
MWLLVGLSVVCLAIILERAYFLIASRDDIDVLRDALIDRLKTGDFDAAATGLRNSKSFEARVAGAGLSDASYGATVVRERMVAETLLAKLSMERNLAFLGTVGNNAPFVGLLGTVIGIIRAFHALNETAGQVSAGLMAEVGEALVATAIGIMVAIPAVAAFNLFQRVIKARLGRAEELSSYVAAWVDRKETQSALAAAE